MLRNHSIHAVSWLQPEAFSQVYSENPEQKAEQKDIEKTPAVCQMNPHKAAEKILCYRLVSHVEKQAWNYYSTGGKKLFYTLVRFHRLVIPHISQAPGNKAINTFKMLFSGEGVCPGFPACMKAFKDALAHAWPLRPWPSRGASAKAIHSTSHVV